MLYFQVSYGTDGILLLVQCVLNLNIPISVEQLNYVSAAVYRMKSKVLSIVSIRIRTLSLGHMARDLISLKIYSALHAIQILCKMKY